MAATTKRTRSRKRAPLWMRVESVLRHKIAVGEYRLGDALPAEPALAASFKVSRVTVREAIKSLAADGLVEQIQGKGTFVIGGSHPDSEQAVLSAFVGNANFNEAFPGISGDPTYHTPDYRFVDIRDVPAPQDVRDLLGLHEESVLLVERLVADVTGPYIYVLDYVPHAIGDRLRVGELSRGWLTQVLNNQLANRIVEARQTVEATLADAVLSERMDVQIGSPMLYSKRVYFDGEGHPMYVAKVWHRGDRYRYEATFKVRDGGDEKTKQ